MSIDACTKRWMTRDQQDMDVAQRAAEAVFNIVASSCSLGRERGTIGATVTIQESNSYEE